MKCNEDCRDIFEERVKDTYKNKIVRWNEILRDNIGKIIGEIDIDGRRYLNIFLPDGGTHSITEVWSKEKDSIIPEVAN